MSIEPNHFRIEPDPQVPGCWQFVDHRRGQIVGGFPTSKAARRAYERETRQAANASAEESPSHD